MEKKYKKYIESIIYHGETPAFRSTKSPNREKGIEKKTFKQKNKVYMSN